MGLFDGLFGGGDNNQKVTTQNKPYPAAVPGMNQYFGDVLKAYQGGALNLKPFPGQTVAPVSPQTGQAWNQITNLANAGSDLNRNATSYVNSVLNPNYLISDSPGLQAVIDNARQGVNAEFSRAGRTFSGAHAGGLASSEGQLRYQDYARKAGERMAMAQFAPQLARERYFDANQLLGVGQQRQAALQDQINAQINRYNALQSGKANELGLFNNLLGGGGPGTSSTTQPVNNGNPFLQGLGTIASIGSLFV